jgi:low affinity Fe/Cu permease
MDQLKKTADDCLENAVKMDKRFDDWLLYTCELHAACVGIESTDEEKLQATAISLAVENTRFDQQKIAVADAKEASEKLKKQLDVASEAFKKASDKFPSG